MEISKYNVSQAPTVVLANITNACNLSCPHCYFNSGKIFADELNTKQWYDIIDQLADYGVKKFRINGGEPFLRADLYDILSRAKNRGLETHIVTNSTLVTEDCLEKFKSKLDMLLLSIDGPDKETNDSLRCSGHFEKAMSVINLADEMSISVGVFTNVSKANYERVNEMIPLLEHMGVKRLAFFYCSPFGSAKENWKSLYLTPKEWRTAKDNIQKTFSEINPKMEVFVEPRFKGLSEKNDAACSLYSKDVCSIDPSGDIYFCSIMINNFSKKWSLGNITETPFKDIWEKSDKWEYMKRAKIEMNSKLCAGCKSMDNCNGGCAGSTLINSTEFLEDACGKEYYPICFMHWEALK